MIKNKFFKATFFYLLCSLNLINCSMIIDSNIFSLISYFFTPKRSKQIVKMQADLKIFQLGKAIKGGENMIIHQGKHCSLNQMLKKEKEDGNPENFNDTREKAIEILWNDIVSEPLNDVASFKSYLTGAIADWTTQRSKYCLEQKGCSNIEKLISQTVGSSLLLEWINRKQGRKEELEHLKQSIKSFKRLNIFVMELFFFCGDMLETMRYHKLGETEKDKKEL